MGSTTVSPILKEAVERVFKDTDQAGYSYAIDFEIFTADGSYKFTPTGPGLSNIAINQAFGPNYTDEIFLSFRMLASEYLDLFKNNVNLMTQVIFRRVDNKKGSFITGVKPLIVKYLAILLNPEDLAAKYNIQDITETRNNPEMEHILSNYMEVSLQLLEDKYYNIRHRKISGIFRDLGVDNMIRYISRALEMPNYKFTPPDNIKTWNTIVIPAVKDVANVYDYLQANYGVYNKGMDYYYTQEMLYIYPPYEVDNVSASEVVNVYTVPTGLYGGALAYHTNPDDHVLHIITNSDVIIKDLSKLSAEEKGNVTAVIPSENMIDGFSTTVDQGSAVNNMTTQVVISKDVQTADPKSANMTYAGVTNNIYTAASEMAKWAASVMVCQWAFCEPFKIYPGHAVKYHYDDTNKYTTRKGIVEGVSYTFNKTGRVDDKNMFTCSATLLIRISNKKET